MSYRMKHSAYQGLYVQIDMKICDACVYNLINTDDNFSVDG